MHPTQKPEALLHRVLLASSNPGDVVLDPFFGTGTTGAMAKRLGRHFVGIEAEAEYAAAARKRIAAETVLDDTSLQVTQSAKQQKRVPFGALVENGMLKPGAQLFGPARKVKARIRADGSLKLGTAKDAPTGSIHKIGATAQGLEACNGWTYWHYKDGDKLLPIDTLREKLRDG